jgi:ABC-type multidrug transport system fused ATPase/permease subunit
LKKSKITIFFEIIGNKEKTTFIKLSILMIFGLFLEIVGFGLLIPIFSLLTDSSVNSFISKAYEILNLNSLTKYKLIIYAMLFLVSFYALKVLFFYYLTLVQSKFISKITANISERLFFNYLKMPYIFHLQNNSAFLIRNIQTEVFQFMEVPKAVLTISTELSGVIAAIVVLIYIEPLGAISLIIFLFIFSFAFYFFTRKRVLKWGESRQFHDGLISKHIMQGLNGIKHIKVLNREKYFFANFKFQNDSRAKIIQWQLVLFQLPKLFLEFLAISAIAFLVIFLLIFSNTVTAILTLMTVFAAASFRMIPSVNRIINALQILKFSIPVIDNFNNEFEKFKENKFNLFENGNNNLVIKKLEIINLNFKYPNTESYSLSNINLIINYGDMIGIIGPSGSGKSTLVDVILGLLNSTSGNFKINNTDLFKDLSFLKTKVGYVSQNLYLIDDTIKRNIAFGLNDDEINNINLLNAIKGASLNDFINQLENGVETIVGENGVRLSGGQKQRIGIARALYLNPDILIFDEATSALDNKTELEVMSAIDNLVGKKTILIIAHRLSTLKNCNRIFEMNKGQLIEKPMNFHV